MAEPDEPDAVEVEPALELHAASSREADTNAAAAVRRLVDLMAFQSRGCVRGRDALAHGAGHTTDHRIHRSN